jgi:hypothetical protein
MREHLPEEVREALEGMDKEMQSFVDVHVRPFTDGKKNMVADSVGIMCLVRLSAAIDQLKEQVALLGVANLASTDHVKGCLVACATIDNTAMAIAKALGADDELVQSYCKSVLKEGKGEEE